MKTLRALALAVFALLLCKGSLSAQSITNLHIGSKVAVIENGLRNADQIQVFVQQLRVDGKYLGVSQGGADRLTFSNKADLDHQVAFYLSKVAQGVIDNDAGQDKDGEFALSVIAVKRYPDTGRTLLFLGGYLGNFRLIRNGNNYSLPDLKSYVIGVPNMNVPIHIPNLAWGRVTFTDENGLRIIDSALDSDPMIDLTRSAIILPKDLATTGAVTISVIYGANMQFFGRFDVDGSLLPENPPTMSLSIPSLAASGIPKTVVIPTSVSLSVRGGDIGRTFSVQSSTNLMNWEGIPGSVFTVNYVYPFVDRNILTDSGGEMRFYRIIPVNRIPVYEK